MAMGCPGTLLVVGDNPKKKKTPFSASGVDVVEKRGEEAENNPRCVFIWIFMRLKNVLLSHGSSSVSLSLSLARL
jgi:hypothetical protein